VGSSITVAGATADDGTTTARSVTIAADGTGTDAGGTRAGE
jgi:hypothetical protein